MDETDGMAIPLPDEEGVVAGRQRAYQSQLLADRWRRLIVFLAGLTVHSVLDLSVRVLSALMIAFPLYIFRDYLHRGILFVSPPLFFMFLGGVAGWFLPPHGLSVEESWPQSGDRQ